MRLFGLPPIAKRDAQVLILGSFPGSQSLREKQYYAYRRNCFWCIIAKVFDSENDIAYSRKIRLLKDNHIALWDVLHSCKREGAVDAGIEHGTECPNDFQSFFSSYPGIHTIFFNGRKAQTLFMQLVQPDLDWPEDRLIYLPSTSPANARMTKAIKLCKWRSINGM